MAAKTKRATARSPAVSAHARASDPSPAEPPHARPQAAEWVPASELHPWPDNTKKPTKAEVRGVADSIIRFGFGAPIVARQANGEIIAGHTRYQAVSLLPRLWKAADADARATWSADARALATDTVQLVPVRYLDVSEYDAHLLALADNRLGAEDDPALLLQQLEMLKAEERALVGWTEEAFAKLRGEKPGVTGDDPGPTEPPKKPVSKLGERYELGPHVLVCGDSRDAASWELLLQGGELVDLVWTDPPYGVEIVGGAGAGSRSVPAAERAKRGGQTIKNDELTPEQLRAFLDAAFGMAIRACAKGAAWYVAAPPGPLFAEFGNALIALKVWRRTLLWLKDSFVMSRGDYHYRHEAIFYGWEPNGPHYWCGRRDLDAVLEFPRPKRSTEHPTMKPPELIEACIENSSKANALVADPFGGSGSTLIAAARTGRRARLIELDPRYCDVIRKRWGDFARGAGIEPGPGAL